MYRQRTHKAWGHTAHRGANGAAIPTDEDDQDGHFFFNHPERGPTPLPKRAQPLLLLFRFNPPTEGVGGEVRQLRPFKFPEMPPFHHSTNLRVLNGAPGVGKGRAHSKRGLCSLDLSEGGTNLTFQCNKKHTQRNARAFRAASPATSHVRSAHTAAAVGAAYTTHARSLSSRLLLAARRTLSELELIQSHMAQKPVLRGEMGCACVAREVSVERGDMGERGCARRLGGWVWVAIDRRGTLVALCSAHLACVPSGE